MKTIVSLSLALGLVLNITGCSFKVAETNSGINVSVDQLNERNFLQSWSDDSPNKKIIVDFVKDATDENSSNFIPVSDRIVTFDMDGTLICERPNYLELECALDKIFSDNSYKPSKELVQKANDVKYQQTLDPKPDGADDLSDEIIG